MTESRKLHVKEMVREQIIYHINEDLYQKGESLMKEVWEEIGGEEYALADQEMLKIIEAIRNIPFED